MQILYVSPPVSFGPTFNGRGTFSAIDFILVSNRHCSRITNFCTHKISLSDHFPQSIGILLFRQEKNRARTPNSIMGEISLARQNGYALRWDRIEPNEFMRKVVTNYKEQILVCLDEKSTCKEIIDGFIVITDHIKKALTLKVNSKKGNLRKEGWFDTNCTKAYRKLKHVLHLEDRSKDKISEARKEYNCALNDRRYKLKLEAWTALREASICKDSSAFWKAVNAHFLKDRDLATIEVAITEYAWLEHFASLYNDPFLGSQVNIDPEDEHLITPNT